MKKDGLILQPAKKDKFLFATRIFSCPTFISHWENLSFLAVK